MIINNDERSITPDAGKMLYDGEVFSDKVYLGIYASPSDWTEVTQEEYEAILEEIKQQEEETPDITDISVQHQGK